jgi:hypothetical protein
MELVRESYDLCSCLEFSGLIPNEVNAGSDTSPSVTSAIPLDGLDTSSNSACLPLPNKPPSDVKNLQPELLTLLRNSKL